MAKFDDIGPLNLERHASGVKTTNAHWPATIAVMDELLDCMADEGTAEVAGDELCFTLSNGRALYRRVEHNLESMIGWYTLLGSVGPTHG